MNYRDRIECLPGICLDDLPAACERYTVAPECLTVDDEKPVEERLYSDLLKSNCPVTGQPDWASIAVDYRGSQIDRAGLLRYIVSYRSHQGFHEHCVETIFADILSRCRPKVLTVRAYYTRRGGLDINPVRSSEPLSIKDVFGDFRLVRQ